MSPRKWHLYGFQASVLENIFVAVCSDVADLFVFKKETSLKDSLIPRPHLQATESWVEPVNEASKELNVASSYL